MKTVHIEILYPEYNNLYGDRGNLRYLCEKLALCGCEVTVTETHLDDCPAFVTENVDVLYIGPCTEEQQERELPRLQKYRDALAQRMQGDTITLATGNAVELFGRYVEKEDGSTVEALGLTDTYAKRFSRLRFNDLCVGDHSGITVVGFKNQLSHSYPVNDTALPKNPFLHMEKGSGYHPESREEGIACGGFIATYLLGPLLPLNPDLTEWLLKQLLGEDHRPCTLPFEREAYARRLAELRG